MNCVQNDMAATPGHVILSVAQRSHVILSVAQRSEESDVAAIAQGLWIPLCARNDVNVNTA